MISNTLLSSECPLHLRVPNIRGPGYTAHAHVDDEEAAQPETNVNSKCSGRIAVWLHLSKWRRGIASLMRTMPLRKRSHTDCCVKKYGQYSHADVNADIQDVINYFTNGRTARARPCWASSTCVKGDPGTHKHFGLFKV